MSCFLLHSVHCLCLFVCLPYYLLLVTFFFLAIFLSYLPFFSFSLRIGLVFFQARCRKRRLNMGYNLSRFIVVFLCLMICISLI